MPHKKRKSFLELKPFKSWSEALGVFQSLVESALDFEVGGSNLAQLIDEMNRFEFRIAQTIEQERRKKR